MTRRLAQKAREKTAKKITRQRTEATRPRVGCWLVGALLLLSCGDNSAEVVAFEDFAIGARVAICDWSVRCGHVPDEATCQRLIDPKDYDDRRAADSIERGRTLYDARMGARCLETTRNGFCLEVPFSDPSCARVFRGLVGEGSVCTSVRECSGGASCVIDTCPGQCCVGVCGPFKALPPLSPKPLAAIGEPCTGHPDCAEGGYCETDRTCTRFPTEPGQRCLVGCARGDLYCDIEGLICRPYAALGEACDPDSPCDPAFSVCDGVCRPRPGIGEPCNSLDRLCIATTLCDRARGHCVARKTLGESCESSRECVAECDNALSRCVDYQSCP